jgi:hypothetical protein
MREELFFGEKKEVGWRMDWQLSFNSPETPTDTLHPSEAIPQCLPDRKVHGRVLHSKVTINYTRKGKGF